MTDLDLNIETTLSSSSDRNVTYPFTANSRFISRNNVVFDTSLFIDAKIYVSANSGLFISAIEKTAKSVIFSISDNQKVVCTGTSDFSTSYVSLLNENQRVTGVLVIDNEAFKTSVADGVYFFSSRALTFVPTVATAINFAGLNSISVENGTVTGDIYLVGGAGVLLEVDGNTIQVNITGEPFYNRRSCIVEGNTFPASQTQSLLGLNFLTAAGDDISFTSTSADPISYVNLSGNTAATTPVNDNSTITSSALRFIPQLNGLQIAVAR